MFPKSNESAPNPLRWNLLTTQARDGFQHQEIGKPVFLLFGNELMTFPAAELAFGQMEEPEHLDARKNSRLFFFRRLRGR